MFYSLSVDPVCYQHSSHTHTVKERSISVTVLFKLTELKLKPLLVATELPSDSVAQLARAWQAIYQVVGSSPSPESLSFSPLFLSHLYFPPFLFTSSLCFSSLFPTFPSHWHWLGLRSDCQVWSMFNWVSMSEPHTSVFNCDFLLYILYIYYVSYVVPHILNLSNLTHVMSIKYV